MKILRWIAVPFAALLGSFLVNAVGGIYEWINTSGASIYTGTENIGLASIIIKLLVSGVSGYVFVYAGSYVAPSSKRTVSVVLATVMAILCFISLCFMFGGLSSFSIFTLLEVLVTAGGSIYASYSMPSEEVQKQKPSTANQQKPTQQVQRCPSGKYNLGYAFRLKMEDGEPIVCVIQSYNPQTGMYRLFSKDVFSLIREDDDKDNPFPQNYQYVNEKTIDDIISGKVIGTNIHYHF